MGGRKRQSLESWINECMTDVEKEGKLRMFSLVHRVSNANGVEVHSTNLGSREYKAVDLANLFQAKADSFAQDLHGPQTFVLLAFWGDKIAPEAAHPLKAESLQDGLGASSEGPDETGMRMQKMRHTDMTHNQMFAKQQHLDDYSLALLKQSYEREKTRDDYIAKLQQDNFEAFDIVKTFIQDKMMDDRKFKMEVLAFERSSNERAKWLGMAPGLANKLFGKEVFPQSTADTSLVEAILDALPESQEELMKLMSALKLKPEVLAVLMSRGQEYFENKKKAKEEIARSLPAHEDPAKDAAGGGDDVE